MPSPHPAEPPLRERLFHASRVALSLTVGLLISWVVGSATWNVWGTPGVPVLKGILLFTAGMVGYYVMDRRIMGESQKPFEKDVPPRRGEPAPDLIRGDGVGPHQAQTPKGFDKK